MMKNVTYPEEFLLGRVQFFLRKGFLQNTVSKKRMDYGEVFC